MQLPAGKKYSKIELLWGLGRVPGVVSLVSSFFYFSGLRLFCRNKISSAGIPAAVNKTKRTRNALFFKSMAALLRLKQPVNARLLS